MFSNKKSGQKLKTHIWVWVRKWKVLCTLDQALGKFWTM